jgi:hypothetical protein
MHHNPPPELSAPSLPDIQHKFLMPNDISGVIISQKKETCLFIYLTSLNVRKKKRQSATKYFQKKNISPNLDHNFFLRNCKSPQRVSTLDA